jgi:hypothetical protein
MKMDIQALKIDLVDKIIKTEKQSILIKVSELLQKEKSKDWWEQLPLEIQESILDGAKDVKEGNVYTHEQVIQEAREKYGY